MSSLKMRRINFTASDGAKQFAKLKEQLRHESDVVSPAAKKLTVNVFGKVLTPAEVVTRICTDVQTKGIEAVLKYTEAFDKVKLKPESIRVKDEELAAAHKAADPAFLETLRRIKFNIDSFQSGLMHRDAEMRVSGSHEIIMRYRPLDRIGIYCPGGAAAYPSTLLMTVCPAKVAGVQNIVVCMPPKDTGASNKDLLATCYELGVDEVYRIGGAQAIAAMAYGVQGLHPVDMIVGPGNQYIALAKKHVYGTVGIDCLAGQSEVVVVADDSAHPHYVALDLIAQAEHCPGSAILITWFPPLLEEVYAALEKRLAKHGRGDQTRESLERLGALILTKDKHEAVDVVNELAPEHLHLQTRDIDAFSDEVMHAGAIFLGPFTPVAVGDYASGPSHVLPTGGTARFASGLNANDFRRRTSVMRYTKNGMKEIAPDVVYLARKEGLEVHAESIDLRAKDNGPAARPKPKPERASQPPSPLKK